MASAVRLAGQLWPSNLTSGPCCTPSASLGAFPFVVSALDQGFHRQSMGVLSGLLCSSWEPGGFAAVKL